MGDDSFRESLKVDADTLARLESVSKNHAKESAANKGNSSRPGGRERGDDGPGKTGRESGYKSGSSSRIDAVKNTSSKTGSSDHSARTAAVKGINTAGNNAGASAGGQGHGHAASGGKGQGASGGSGQGASGGKGQGGGQGK